MPQTALSAVPALRRWSTEVVGPARRLDYWVGAICEAFLEMDCSSRDAPSFSGALTSLPVDTISLNQVLASTQDVYRTAGGIARSAHSPFYLITQLDSSWHVRQGGQMAQLRPGDLALVDSAQCYELHFPHSVACLSIQLPRAWVGRWLTQVDCQAPRVVPRDRGWGQTLSALGLQLGREPALASALPPLLLSEHLGALLAAALEPSLEPPGPALRGAHARACALLREQFDQPGLCAETVARQVGVSLRTLHRSFAAQGTTFAGTLRGLRLEQAARLLAQPRLARVAVGELGRRCGFTDASHFVREFQRVHGATPARWRRDRRSD